MIEHAKKTGTWNALDEVEQLIIPPDLQTELDKNPTANTHFQNFPPSSKRGILEWIFNAKRPATRAKRIQTTAEMAAENKRANHYRQ
ncbi:MAG: YdeI family protein [Saprospiraceae bacterium]